jgi:hypothetical protein
MPHLGVAESRTCSGAPHSMPKSPQQVGDSPLSRPLRQIASSGSFKPVWSRANTVFRMTIGISYAVLMTLSIHYPGEAGKFPAGPVAPAALLLS